MNKQQLYIERTVHIPVFRVFESRSTGTQTLSEKQGKRPTGRTQVILLALRLVYGKEENIEEKLFEAEMNFGNGDSPLFGDLGSQNAQSLLRDPSG